MYLRIIFFVMNNQYDQPLVWEDKSSFFNNLFYLVLLRIYSINCLHEEGAFFSSEKIKSLSLTTYIL